MNNHDWSRVLTEQKELIERISPEFADLTADLSEVMDKADDPKVLAALLFRLAMERQKTNQLIEGINDKFDKIMFSIKTTQPQQEITGQKAEGFFEVLPEQDQAILKNIEENGKATAQDIQKIMNYKGLNAASQRLNKLYKEGYLKKVQAGKKVLYLTKN